MILDEGMITSKDGRGLEERVVSGRIAEKGLPLSENDGSYILPAGRRRELVQREQLRLRPGCAEVHWTLRKNEQIYPEGAGCSTAAPTRDHLFHPQTFLFQNLSPPVHFYIHCF